MRNNRQRRGLSEINVVPYIDVMLVLLIIFMVTAPLLTQGVEVRLPNANAKEMQSSDTLPLIVTVGKTGQYYLNIAATPTTPITPQQLTVQVAAALQLAAKEHKDKAVYVKGDTDANYGEVVSAMALLQQAGAQNVGLMTTMLK